MKKRTWVLSSIAIMALITLITGCPQKVESVSVSERMDSFISDLNANNLLNLKGHTHPEAGQYNAANTAVWAELYALEPLSIVSYSGNTARVVGTSVYYIFYLEEDDPEVYKIRKIARESGGTAIFE